MSVIFLSQYGTHILKNWPQMIFRSQTSDFKSDYVCPKLLDFDVWSIIGCVKVRVSQHTSNQYHRADLRPNGTHFLKITKNAHFSNVGLVICPFLISYISCFWLWNSKLGNSQNSDKRSFRILISKTDSQVSKTFFHTEEFLLRDLRLPLMDLFPAAFAWFWPVPSISRETWKNMLVIAQNSDNKNIWRKLISSTESEMSTFLFTNFLLNFSKPYLT